MQAKDIPDRPILAFVAENGGIGCHWFVPEGTTSRSVLCAMPPGTPPKLALAKMKGLMRRGLVGGCGCGCRGDFELTDKGREVLNGG